MRMCFSVFSVLSIYDSNCCCCCCWMCTSMSGVSCWNKVVSRITARAATAFSLSHPSIEVYLIFKPMRDTCADTRHSQSSAAIRVSAFESNCRLRQNRKKKITKSNRQIGWLCRISIGSITGRRRLILNQHCNELTYNRGRIDCLWRCRIHDKPVIHTRVFLFHKLRFVCHLTVGMRTSFDTLFRPWERMAKEWERLVTGEQRGWDIQDRITECRSEPDAISNFNHFLWQEHFLLCRANDHFSSNKKKSFFSCLSCAIMQCLANCLCASVCTVRSMDNGIFGFPAIEAKQ